MYLHVKFTCTTIVLSFLHVDLYVYYHLIIGCPVVLCSLDHCELETYEELTAIQRQSIAASLIHCVNWFRELVSISIHV